LLDVFFFSSRRRHTRWPRDWSSDVCSSDLLLAMAFPWPWPPLRGDALTVTGSTLAEEAAKAKETPSQEVVRKLNAPLKPTGGLEIGRASCRERVQSTAMTR